MIFPEFTKLLQSGHAVWRLWPSSLVKGLQTEHILQNQAHTKTDQFINAVFVLDVYVISD